MNKKIEKVRLDQLLVNLGLAESKNKAQAMVMAGEVYIKEEKQLKAGHKVQSSVDIKIKNIIGKYVSRGGLKLEGALKTFKLSVKDKVCFDVGASTGGFTDCLLQQGAKKMYSLDVGKNQLHYKLQEHPRVSWLESCHIKNFAPKQTFAPDDLSQKIDLIVADCSFIALEKVLPYVICCMHDNSSIIALIKPQFQAQAKDLDKGVIKDEVKRQELIQECIKNIETTLNLTSQGTCDSPIKGPKGNLECFVWFKMQL